MKTSKIASVALAFAIAAASTGCCNQATRNCKVTYLQDGSTPSMQAPAPR